MDFNVLDNVKSAIEGICPIIASTNWRRRAGDDQNGSNPFTQFLIRTTVSIIVAGIIGIGSGMFSAYIIVQKMEVKLDNITDRQNNNSKRYDRLEDRVNSHMENHR